VTTTHRSPPCEVYAHAKKEAWHEKVRRSAATYGHGEAVSDASAKALKRPEIWAANQYVRSIRTETSGERAATHLAEIRTPLGVAVRAYVKHFPDNVPRGMFNEIFGYVVMSALGVPQPNVAIMQAPIDMLPTKPWSWAFVSIEPRPVFDGTPKQLYNIQIPEQHTKLVQRLFACPALPLLIAADQVLKNADRNIGNLVFTGKSSFVAIDNGEILGGGAWRLGDLWFSQSWAVSKLIECLVPLDSLKPEMRSAICASAQVVADKFFEAQNDLRLALECEMSTDATVAMDALWWRCLSLADWFGDRLKLIV
jgi:hypothetical protein